MKKLLKIMIVVVAMSYAITGCTKDENITVEEPSGKGYVSGTVRDVNGNPLPGASITVEHTVWFDHYVTCTSDANGNYKASAPATPAGSWTIKGQVERDAYGEQYTCDLEVNDTSSFYPTDVKERNFTWKLSGQKPGGSFYGAHVDIYQSGAAINMTDVILQLTPLDAQLLDGSNAVAIEKTVEDVGGTFMIKDIPIGRYSIKAIYPGKTLLLQNRNKADEPGVEKEVIFGKNGYLAATEYNIEFWISE